MLNDRVYDDIFHNSNLPSHYCKTTDLTSMKGISLYTATLATVCVDKRCTYEHSTLLTDIHCIIFTITNIVYYKNYINMILTNFQKKILTMSCLYVKLDVE